MEIFKAMTILFVVPVLGILTYLKIHGDMYKKFIPNPPNIQLFALFSTFGGWLFMLLTAFFWGWSGLGALIFFYLLFISPFVILGCIFSLYPERDVSRYHFYTLAACFAYLILGACLFIFIVLAINYNRE